MWTTLERCQKLGGDNSLGDDNGSIHKFHMAWLRNYIPLLTVCISPICRLYIVGETVVVHLKLVDLLVSCLFT